VKDEVVAHLIRDHDGLMTHHELGQPLELLSPKNRADRVGGSDDDHRAGTGQSLIDPVQVEMTGLVKRDIQRLASRGQHGRSRARGAHASAAGVADMESRLSSGVR